MGFITHVKVKLMTTIAQSLGGKRWKYTIEKFLYYMWSGIISLEGRMW